MPTCWRSIASRSQAMSVAFDYVVVYHTVHEDFSKLSPPRMDTPIMPDAQYLASYKKYVDKINAINKAAESRASQLRQADTATAEALPQTKLAGPPRRNCSIAYPAVSVPRKKALAAKEERDSTRDEPGRSRLNMTPPPEGKTTRRKGTTTRHKECDAARKELQADQEQAACRRYGAFQR